MANKFFVLAIFCGVQVLTVCCADLEKCLCSDNFTGATWGHMLNSTECHGKCDVAEKTEYWTCILDHNTTSICKRVVPCVINDTCEGTWGVWGNIGSCNATCGKGFRPRERRCYKNITTGNKTIQYLRNKYCLGGKGSKTQQQWKECEKGSCTTIIKSTTSVKFRTIASQQNAEIIRTTKSSVIIDLLTDYESPKDLNIGLGNEEKRDSPTIQPNGLDCVTLAAILGSVAIVCVTIVALAVAIMFLKRHNIKKNASSLPNSKSIVKIGSIRNRRNDVNSDSVPLPMPLPSSTSAYGQVSNPLYETAFANGEPIQGSIKKPH